MNYGEKDLGTYISQQKEDWKHCPECQGQMIQQRHEYVCADCGLILDELQLVNSYQFQEIKVTDYRGNDQFVSIGTVVSNVCNLGTDIGYYSNKVFYDYRGTLISSNQQHVFQKLKLWYSLPLKIKDHETDYRILKMLAQIGQIVQATKEAQDRAAYLYQKRIKEGTITNHVTLIAACLMFAVRDLKAPITIRDIAIAFQQTGHRVYPRLIVRDMMDIKQYVDINTQPHTADAFIARYIATLQKDNILTKRLVQKKYPCTLMEYLRLLEAQAIEINTLYYNQPRCRCVNPSTLGAAMVYASTFLLKYHFRCANIMTQRILSNCTGIEEYAIRDHYAKIIRPFLKKNELELGVNQ